jgi:hypothetical protein
MTTTETPEIDQQNIFRFKFDHDLTNEMQHFAKIHKHDSRLDFKENFDDWFNNNSELINREKNRLDSIGYDDDIKVKLFRSIKYYYVKKSPTKIQVRATRSVKYLQHQKEFTQNITSYISTECIPIKKSPKDSYQSFIERFNNEISTEINNLNEKFSLSKEHAENKIKKTFKNQYFQLNKNKN